MAGNNYKYINNCMIKRAAKGKKVYVSRHDHSLKLDIKDERNFDEDSNWRCDICRVSFSGDIYSFRVKNVTIMYASDALRKML